MGCMGYLVLKMLNIDVFVVNGMFWEWFYVVSLVCMLNWVSFMICWMLLSYGVRVNGILFDKCNVIFVEFLWDVGYKIVLIGKSYL